MKPENTSLVNIGYIKTKNKYHASFLISNLDAKQRKQIMKIARPTSRIGFSTPNNLYFV